MLKDYLDSLEDQFESQSGLGSDWLKSFKLRSFNTCLLYTSDAADE